MILSADAFLQDDLQAFRALIFKDIPAYESSYVSFEGEDDGLGHYPDGVKRTLTDDQIAMFRHSEVYAIIRERQLRKENANVDRADESSPTLNSDSAAVIGEEGALEEGIDVDTDDEGEYARFLEAERQEMETDAARKKKRKRKTADGFDEHGRPPTMRRLAREMDEATTADTVLVYDEEDGPSAIPTTNLENSAETSEWKKACHEDRLDSNSVAAPKPAREGRKIWWPTIGGS